MQLLPRSSLPELPHLWKAVNFAPNDQQKEAIQHPDGPLFLPAGPGSGKTRVLLWRVLNLLVYRGVAPEEIFLATFTEKAALQLREGLRSLLSLVTDRTGVYYDTSKIYVGTVHSLCQRLLTDRRFAVGRQRKRPPVLLDDLGQYLFLRRLRNWTALKEASGFLHDHNRAINALFGVTSMSRHVAASNCLSLFNRLSEECLDAQEVARNLRDPDLRRLLKMYSAYRQMLEPDSAVARVDFPLIQQKALAVLEAYPASAQVFRHVIIDEYQDTNTVQERLFFKLVAGHKNICVVGDDDQALYRFRGATVENFVEFPKRCKKHLGLDPSQIVLSINYRSRKLIVDFYTEFMRHPICDWRKKGKSGEFYRVVDKGIRAHRTDASPSVVATAPSDPQDAATEIAELVHRIIQEKKVEDPHQVAFLFPSLKSAQVQKMRDALEAKGLHVYAPRAGRFLEVEEATAIFGLLFQVFGKPERGSFGSRDYANYFDWVDEACRVAKNLLAQDGILDRYVRERRALGPTLKREPVVSV